MTCLNLLNSNIHRDSFTMYKYLQISFFLWSNTSVVQNRRQAPFVIYWGWPRQRETQRVCQKALATNTKYCNPLSFKKCSAKTTDTRENKATSQVLTCELSKASMERGEVTGWMREKSQEVLITSVHRASVLDWQPHSKHRPLRIKENQNHL